MNDYQTDKIGGLFILGGVPGERSKRAILFVHGGGLNYKSGMPIVDFFSKEGFVAFTMSLRGHTGSYEPDEFNLTTLDDYKTDIENIITHLSSKYDIDLKNIFIVAHSLSALPALKIITYKKLGGLVLLAPALTKEVHDKYNGDLTKAYKIPVEEDLAERRFEIIELSQPFLNLLFGSKHDLSEFKGILSREPQSTRYQFLIEGYSVDPKKLRSPVMVLIGSKDTLMVEEGAKSLASLYRAEYYILDSSHMIMLDDKWEFAAQKILDFINPLGSN